MIVCHITASLSTNKFNPKLGSKAIPNYIEFIGQNHFPLENILNVVYTT